MGLPKSLKTATPLSKILALVAFIILTLAISFVYIRYVKQILLPLELKDTARESRQRNKELLAYVKCRGENYYGLCSDRISDGIGDLYIYDAVSGGESEITNSGDVTSLYSWSPNNRYIAAARMVAAGDPYFHEGLGELIRPKRPQLIVIDTGDGSVQVVGDLIDEYDIEVGWIDDDTLAFVADGSVSDFTIGDTEENKLIELKHADPSEIAYTIGKNAEYVSYNSTYAHPPNPIYLVDLRKKTEELIYDGNFGAELLGIYKNAVFYASGNYSEDLNIYEYSIANRAHELFIETERIDRVFDFDTNGDTTIISGALRGDESTTVSGYRYPHSEIVAYVNSETRTIAITDAEEYVFDVGLSKSGEFGMYKLRPSLVLKRSDPSYDKTEGLYVFSTVGDQAFLICPSSPCRSGIWQN